MPACTRSFFIAIPLGFLMALGVFMGLVYRQLGAPTNYSYWCSEVYRRKHEIADRTPSPKLVLLGGSSSFFGIKAANLERELSIPTLNAGTHAGLGIAYILERGKQFLQPGDTVLLVPEFELLFAGETNRQIWASSMYVDYVLARDPAYYRALPLLAQLEIAFMTSFKRLNQGLASRKNPEHPNPIEGFSAYDPSLVDSHGDMTGHLAQRRPDSCPVRDQGICTPLIYGLPQDSPGFPLLAPFCHWAAQNHIRVLATFPNAAHQPGYDAPAAFAFEKQMSDLYSSLGVPVIGRLHDALLPPSDFFDSNYHLTDEASVRRTSRLAQQLKPWFAPPPPSKP